MRFRIISEYSKIFGDRIKKIEKYFKVTSIFKESDRDIVITKYYVVYRNVIYLDKANFGKNG